MLAQLTGLGKPFDDASLGVIFSEYDVPFEADVIIECDEVINDIINSNAAYNQYTAPCTEPLTCLTFNIIFPNSRDLENHLPVHDSKYNDWSLINVIIHSYFSMFVA